MDLERAMLGRGLGYQVTNHLNLYGKMMCGMNYSFGRSNCAKVYVRFTSKKITTRTVLGIIWEHLALVGSEAS